MKYKLVLLGALIAAGVGSYIWYQQKYLPSVSLEPAAENATEQAPAGTADGASSSAIPGVNTESALEVAPISEDPAEATTQDQVNSQVNPQENLITAESPDELIRAREEVRKAYETLLSLSPPPEGTESASIIPPPRFLGWSPEQVQQLLDNPAVQSYLKLFSNPSFSEGMAKVASHPRLKFLGYAELALFLLMVLFRSWRLARSRYFFGKLWIRFYSFAGYVLLAAVVLPVVILGEGYSSLLQGLSEFLRSKVG